MELLKLLILVQTFSTGCQHIYLLKRVHLILEYRYARCVYYIVTVDITKTADFLLKIESKKRGKFICVCDFYYFT